MSDVIGLPPRIVSWCLDKNKPPDLCDPCRGCSWIFDTSGFGAGIYTMPKHTNPNPPGDQIFDLICDRPNSAHFRIPMAWLNVNGGVFGSVVFGTGINGIPWPIGGGDPFRPCNVLFDYFTTWDDHLGPGNPVTIFTLTQEVPIIVAQIEREYPAGHFNSTVPGGEDSPPAFDWNGLLPYKNFDSEGIIIDELLLRVLDPEDTTLTDDQRNQFLTTHETQPLVGAGVLQYDGPITEDDVRYNLALGLEVPEVSGVGTSLEGVSFKFWPNNQFPDGQNAEGTFMWAVPVGTVLQLNNVWYNIKVGPNGEPASPDPPP
jgi:hypothetical protein